MATFRTPIVRGIVGLMLAIPVAALAATDLGRIFALAPAAGEGVLIASLNGLYLAQADGRINLQAEREGGFVALAADPNNARVLYASGQSGGLLRSDDGGKQWARHSRGGPGNFGLLAVSPADPKRLYGVADGFYRSADGGLTWSRAGEAPDKLMSISADLKRVYAGTEDGLRFSDNGGGKWAPGSMTRVPVTMISANKEGKLTSFNWGQGLLTADNAKLSWAPLSNGFGGQAVIAWAQNGKAQFAATHVGKLFVSSDGGRNWQPINGPRGPETAAEKNGAKLFATYCQACHGQNGIGEAPQAGKVEQTPAPALDETAHAWHHTDEQLLETILKGGPAPNSRMIAWEKWLKPAEAKDLIAYLKSLWDERALRCQGPKHMDPGCMN